MLMCDGCTAGWHYYCLPDALDEVPEGLWLCPDCLKAGVTVAQIQANQDRYREAPPLSRPNLELPSPARLTKARQLAEEWHGQVVVHETRVGKRTGRIVFQDVREDKWFKIYWTDGTSQEYTTRILPKLGIIPEADAPDGILPRPEPVRVVVAAEARGHLWSIRTADDVHRRLTQALPGNHDRGASCRIHSFASKARLRRSLTRVTPPEEVVALTSVLDFTSCRRILDPWADNPAVATSFEHPGSLLIVNDVLGRAKVTGQLDPLESPMYQVTVQKLGALEAVVMSPPLEFADLAFVNAMEFASHVVCMQVSHAWLSSATAPRFQLLYALEGERRLAVIRRADTAADLCWVCAFGSAEQKSVMVRPSFDSKEVELWVENNPA